MIFRSSVLGSFVGVLGGRWIRRRVVYGCTGYEWRKGRGARGGVRISGWLSAEGGGEWVWEEKGSADCGGGCDGGLGYWGGQAVVVFESVKGGE